MKYILLFFVCQVTFAQWIVQNSNTQASFRTVSAIDKNTCWVSGSGGTVLRTLDGGTSWQKLTVPNTDQLDFRDIHAFDSQTAIIMSAGDGSEGKAKLYKTTDGGTNWKLVYSTDQKGVFFDSIDFWDRQHGIAFSDPIDGKFYIIVTSDGGDTWKRINSENIPAVKDGEAAFAASGTALVVQGNTNAWIGTGGENGGRVFYSTDQGQTWQVSETTIKAGKTSGVFGVRFLDAKTGVAIGGNYENVKEAFLNVNVTKNGGKTWTAASQTVPAGLKEGVAIYNKNTLVAVGPSGTCYSTNWGKTWTKIDESALHAVSFVGKSGWAVGGKGQIVKFNDAILNQGAK
ncbi:oxidoreductase [Cytophagaceae bacterium DM2B3-1]|uniref:Oxidoreductase n=1 Tax=Xanthocytophaga flava TaxID=3048013 RepID=A0ABT7CWB8_9BACT|nr:oxidoreductase [Xanthocytophaga flavus]MDJ1498023.1 oxidoreductase [Xanthocytophaga flavus]